MKPLISVVMSVYNEPLDVLKKATDSILNQSVKNIQFIVIVDNPDNKEAIKYLNDVQNLELYINEKNIGLAASLNKGIRKSKAQYIARMDADDISVPDRLEKEYQFLKKTNSDLVTSDRYLIDEKGNIINDNKYKVPRSSQEIRRRLKHGNCLVHPTFLFNKNIFNKAGGYKENLYSAEDYGLVMDILRSDGKISCLPEKLIYYRIRQQSITRKNKILQTYLNYYISEVIKGKRQYRNDEVSLAVSGDPNSEFNNYKHSLENYYKNISNKNKIEKKFTQLKLFLTDKYVRSTLINSYALTHNC